MILFFTLVTKLNDTSTRYNGIDFVNILTVEGCFMPITNLKSRLIYNLHSRTRNESYKNLVDMSPKKVDINRLPFDYVI